MGLKPGYKQTEVGVIPEEWMTRRLRALVDRNAPIAYGVLKPGPYVHGGVPLLQIRDVIHGQINIDELHRISEELERQYSRTRLVGGEIVVSLVGTIGRVALLPVTLAGSNLHRNLARVRVSKDYDSRFVCYYLSSDRAQTGIRLTTFGSTQALLNLADLRNLLIVCPPLPEQRAIATVLNDVDELLTRLDRLIAKKRDLKQAAMQQLLTGQTRLPGFYRNWEVKMLGDVADILKGRALSKSLVTATGTRPCILYGELFTTYGRVISEVVGYTNSSEGYPSVSGDVLMPGSTTTTGIDLATASALFLNNVSLGGDILIIRKKQEAYDPVFLANYLTHSRSAQIAELSQGITIHHLYGKDLKRLSLELPSVPEQTEIANVLTDMDAEVAVLEQRREKTHALKQAMMQELLTGRTRLISLKETHA